MGEKMTKKDYINIAQILLDYADSENMGKYKTLVDKFSYMLKRENEKFDVEKFKKACGIE
jgi:hypothetical protein